LTNPDATTTIVLPDSMTGFLRSVLAFNRDNPRELAIGDRSGHIAVLDVNNQSVREHLTRSLTIDENTITALAFDEGDLISGDERGIIKRHARVESAYKKQQERGWLTEKLRMATYAACGAV